MRIKRPVESRIGPSGGFGFIPGELLTLSKQIFALNLSGPQPGNSSQNQIFEIPE